MPETQTLAERQAADPSARQHAPRSQNATIGDVDRDPVHLLREKSAGRVEALIPLRYGRMSVSPFTIFRPQKYGIAAANGSPLRKSINEALLAMYEDGTFEQIDGKWFFPAK